MVSQPDKNNFIEFYRALKNGRTDSQQANYIFSFHYCVLLFQDKNRMAGWLVDSAANLQESTAVHIV
jgi:hypothetical protein